MREHVNECVGCPPNMGCLGDLCPYVNVAIDYCDQCGEEGAEYRIDNEDYCEICAKKYLQGIFDDLSVLEKAELLDEDVSKIDD